MVWTVLEEPLTGLPSLPWFDAEEWTWGHGAPFELPVSFGVMIENFRDVAHFAFVHKGTMGTMPEVVEPLEPERNGFEVTLHRKMRTGEGGEEVWGSLREVRYHLIAPNLTAVQMFTTGAERCLVHAARAIGATESAHYWAAGFTEDFDECSLEEAIEAEGRVYAEDLPIISAVEPRELSLHPGSDLNTLADRFTLAYREAFKEFVSRALETHPAQPSSRAS
jgi:phenylpropionate dioxygenase-like ring-hydroxylating dioxygenase large terminal subunit